MDNFDEFLKEKAKEEKQKYETPKAFDNKIEEALTHLDSNKINNRFNLNKKLMAMVAGFAFVLIVGVSGVGINKTILDNSQKDVKGSNSEIQRASITEDELKATNYNESVSDNVIEKDNINTITFKYFGDSSKYKSINNGEDVQRIVSFINTIHIKETEKTIENEWDFLIQTNGPNSNIIIVLDNLISINDKVYELVNWDKNSLVNLYRELNYEEYDIKYCPTN